MKLGALEAPLRYLHLLAGLQGVVLVFLGDLYGDLTLEDLHTGVAQVFTHKVLQVEAYRMWE